MLCAGDRMDMEQLKERVQCWCKALAAQDSSHEKLLEGSRKFHELILSVWSLDTSYAVDAAELVCNTLR